LFFQWIQRSKPGHDFFPIVFTPGGLVAPLLCCLLWLLPDHFTAPDCLMRSRYSAFLVSRTDYLAATWHAFDAVRCGGGSGDQLPGWCGSTLWTDHAEVDEAATARQVAGAYP
jgi:hypothetical protein